ncbi:MAG: hypothetical protein MUO50_00065 [Longimicrobiales bacterium]|nr:hypothetical protein [Longimicrobiales bacterium]
MRNPFLSPPPLEEFQLLEVHELIRDYPELLSLFRRWGIRVREAGTTALPSGLFSGGGEGEGSFETLAWRGEAGS